MCRLIIAGTSSGSGKTSIVCGLLNALINRKLNINSYKCGPDYIDSIFHSKILGVDVSNLDAFFCNRDILCTLLDKPGISIIEGVMGYYDGIAMTDKASTYDIARLTDTPAVLVVNCKGMSNSIGAIIKGFMQYKEDSNIKGVILNRLSPMLYDAMNDICNMNGIKLYGFLPDIKDASFKSRHLGLDISDGIDTLKEKINLITQNIEKYIDLDGLISLARSAKKLSYKKIVIDKITDKTVAIARDEAFCFNYSDNIDLLKRLGCNIKYFSPLRDKKLPRCDRLILSGGYPELYKKELSQNISMLNDIRYHINKGLKVIAECGGFMYLNDSIDNEPMAGVIKGNAFQTNRLQKFGYINLRANKDNLLCKKGELIRAHEFHYYNADNCGEDFYCEKPISKTYWHSGHLSDTYYFGYPHIYFWGNIEAIKKFVMD